MLLFFIFFHVPDTTAQASASDNCAMTWSNDFTAVVPGCGGTGSVDVTFTVSDGCGGTDTTSATFAIAATTPPSIVTAASDATAECGDTAALDDWLNANGGVRQSVDQRAGIDCLLLLQADASSCGPVTWTHSYTNDMLSDDCGETGSVAVTFTATDLCSNLFATTTATFAFEDTTAPTITTPAMDLIDVECDGSGNADQLNAWLAAHGHVSDTTHATVCALCFYFSVGHCHGYLR